MSLQRKKRRQVGELSSKNEYPKLILSEALSIALAGKKAEGIRERTAKDYQKTWNYFTQWLSANHEDIDTVDQLTPTVFRNYVNYLKYDAKRYSGHKFLEAGEHGTGLAETTINIRLRCYRSIFNYLERDGLIEVNPMDNVKLLKQDIDLTNCLTEEEVKKVLQQPKQRTYVGFRDFVAMNLLLDSGLRLNELLGLVAGDIDFSTRFITLSGNRSKNRNPRIVPISAYVMKLILHLLTENRTHFNSERLFLSTYGEPLGPNQLNKRLKYYAEKAEIKAIKATAHVYRHTWAKQMILNGCDAFTLQKMGGWSDIRTMRRYIQMDLSEMRSSHDDYSPVNKFHKKMNAFRK